MSETNNDMRVFVHNLSYDTKEEDLANFFIEQGICPDPQITIMMHPRNKKPAGCALVMFASTEEVEKAMSYDNHQFQGRKLYVNKDHDNHHIRRFCSKFRLDFKLNEAGQPELCEAGLEKPTVGGDNSQANGKRLFLQNLPYDLFFGEVKDFLKNDVGLENPYVMIINNPSNGKGCGGAYVEVANDEDIEKLMSKDGQQVKFGDKQERKLWVNHDPAHNFLKKFCDKQNFDFKLSGHRQRPEIIPRGGNSDNRGPPHGSDNRGPPPPFENSPFGSQQMPTDDGKGNPLIQQIPDLLASAVFVANLSYKVNEDDIYRHFESIGKVHNVKLQKYSDDFEDASKAGKSKGLALVEFARARDAARAIVMLAGRNLGGRDINVRPAKEQRNLPNRLSELGRPVSEQICADMCRSSLNVSPFDPVTLFCHNIGFDAAEDDIREIFELVADVKRCVLLTNKETGKSRGNAVIKCATGIDAQQCLNVLHEAKLDGRPMRLRLDRDESGKPRDQQPPPPGNYGAAPSFGQPPMNSYSTYQPPQRDEYRRNDDFNRGPPPPRFGDDNRGRDQYRAPPPQQHQAPPQDKDSQISQLASLLGMSTDALNAVRQLTGGNGGQNNGYSAPPQQNNTYSAPPPPQQNNWKREAPPANHYRERSPMRKQESNNSYQSQNNGNNNGYSQPPQQPPQQPPSSQQKAANKNWNPVTQDTIYLRNLPPTMTESRLRYLISQCGQISFIDFPMNRDNSPVGYAYIRFDGDSALTAAKQAIAQYDNYPIEGQRLECGLY